MYKKEERFTNDSQLNNYMMKLSLCIILRELPLHMSIFFVAVFIVFLVALKDKMSDLQAEFVLKL